jgi:threonine dehydratase
MAKPVDYLREVLNAQIYDLAVETSLDVAAIASQKLGVKVLLKREDQQPVFSFKLRGAYNKLLKLKHAGIHRGVLAVSAGNHAQGVALAAKHLNLEATIVMPLTTPSIKVKAVESFGAKVVLFGDSFNDAERHGRGIADQENLTWVHPFDDVDVIAGQGTIAMELLRQANDIGAVFVPVGGGGLIAGIAAFIKALRPHIQIIAVEPDDAASLAAALSAGKPVDLAHVGLFVDGVAVKRVGEEPFKIAQASVDHVMQVSADEVCAGIRDIFEETRTVVEPAGALALAGIKRYLAEQRPSIDGALVAIVCGANMNFDRLRHVAERAQIGEQHEAVLGVRIPEKPGSFLAFCQALGKRAITEFNYRMAEGSAADVFVGVALRSGRAEKQSVISTLQFAGYEVADYSDNEAAKLHVRHMIGGRKAAAPEQIYRFEFPERPGALLDFLTALSGRWNISLFHYRNHGAAYGRVLVGLNVPEAELNELHQKLDGIGFVRTDERNNAAIQQFLG